MWQWVDCLSRWHTCNTVSFCFQLWLLMITGFHAAGDKLRSDYAPGFTGKSLLHVFSLPSLQCHNCIPFQLDIKVFLLRFVFFPSCLCTHRTSHPFTFGEPLPDLPHHKCCCLITSVPLHNEGEKEGLGTTCILFCHCCQSSPVLQLMAMFVLLLQRWQLHWSCSLQQTWRVCST